MSGVRKLIDRILAGPGYEERYRSRLDRYPKLAKRVPPKLEDISNDSPPWHCNGFAFRMATYSESSEIVFQRMNRLLDLPKKSDGWCRELKRWENSKDHWTDGWKKYYEFLWLLQCYEYFDQSQKEVTFPGTKKQAAPDLKVKTKDGKCFYVECSVYSKWWCLEMFLEDILGLIDQSLSFDRRFNLKEMSNTRLVPEDIGKILECFTRHLTPDKINDAKEEAAKEWPFVLCEWAGLKIVVEDDDVEKYRGSSSDQNGDPRYSLKVYIDEIAQSKCKSNSLKIYRPNLLMVNGLGYDFQNIFSHIDQIETSFNCENIDRLKVYTCGINESLTECQRVYEIPRLEKS